MILKQTVPHTTKKRSGQEPKKKSEGRVGRKESGFKKMRQASYGKTQTPASKGLAQFSTLRNITVLLDYQISQIRHIQSVDDGLDHHVVFAGIGMILPVKRYEGRLIV